MAKKSGGLAKLFKDVKKSQKKVDKLFGSKPAPAKKAAAPKEPKWVTKEGKLTGYKPAQVDSDAVVEVEQDGDRWAVTADGVTLGYLPAALAKYTEAHEDDMQGAEFDAETGVVTIEFCIE